MPAHPTNIKYPNEIGWYIFNFGYGKDGINTINNIKNLADNPITGILDYRLLPDKGYIYIKCYSAQDVLSKLQSLYGIYFPVTKGSRLTTTIKPLSDEEVISQNIESRKSVEERKLSKEYNFDKILSGEGRRQETANLFNAVSSSKLKFIQTAYNYLVPIEGGFQPFVLYWKKERMMGQHLKAPQQSKPSTHPITKEFFKKTSSVKEAVVHGEKIEGKGIENIEDLKFYIKTLYYEGFVSEDKLKEEDFNAFNISKEMNQRYIEIDNKDLVLDTSNFISKEKIDLIFNTMFEEALDNLDGIYAKKFENEKISFIKTFDIKNFDDYVYVKEAIDTNLENTFEKSIPDPDFNSLAEELNNTGIVVTDDLINKWKDRWEVYKEDQTSIEQINDLVSGKGATDFLNLIKKPYKSKLDKFFIEKQQKEETKEPLKEIEKEVSKEKEIPSKDEIDINMKLYIGFDGIYGKYFYEDKKGNNIEGNIEHTFANIDPNLAQRSEGMENSFLSIITQEGLDFIEEEVLKIFSENIKNKPFVDANDFNEADTRSGYGDLLEVTKNLISFFSLVYPIKIEFMKERLQEK